MIEPAALLAYAEELASDTREVAQRTAVSRAYYAAFLHLRQSALESGALPGQRSAADHHRLQRMLNRSRAADASRLRWLRELRNAADYEIGEPLDPSSSRSAIELAETLIAR